MTIGLTPKTADEVNNQVGVILRQFVDVKESIGHYRENLAGLVLTDPPYSMTADDETTIKTAILQLDSDLDSIDMTFINRLVGLF
jgi:hypothetical protein